jgi:hypothetical protein
VCVRESSLGPDLKRTIEREQRREGQGVVGGERGGSVERRRAAGREKAGQGGRSLGS